MTTSVTTSTAFKALSSTDKYRGAVVEDLQLPPAFALPQDESISRALELAYERDFDYIPCVFAFGSAGTTEQSLTRRFSVLNRNRKPVGYLDVGSLKEKWEAGQADPNAKALLYMIKFQRSTSTPYTVITPLTPLGDLEAFLTHNIFAIITDLERKFLLGVATSQDLENFVKRRGTF
ncbi:hypothetical protein BJ322DRAFT_655179 [Thelephora terrestris]|uniref:CBS domain-containing protein n=1 Tax=Thelephora terrestris TaxID=56493 RepID=A0A9P6HKG6_9AGAM|nr:hypothetical protein BJ322DRAFT_655179 [Thelephora terrestris]